MIRLLAAEANRLLSRRMIWAVVAGIIATAGLAGVTSYFGMRPPSAADVQQQQQMRDQVLADCKASGTSADDCAQQVTGMAQEVPTHDSVMKNADSMGGTIGGFLALLLGASFIGAEYRSGSLGNWLTFVPQRGRVFAAKALTVAAASLAIGVLAVGAAGLVTTGFLRLYYPAVALDAHTLGQAGRTSVIVMVQGLIGFVAALIARHTIAALGVMFGAQIIEQIVTGVAQTVRGAEWLIPLMPSVNANAFIQNGYKYQLIDLTKIEATGGPTFTDKILPFANGAAYVGIGLAVVLAGAYLVFRRRDVQ